MGGNGSRTLRIAARLADAVNLPSDQRTLSDRLARLHTACGPVGRDPSDIAITVLDVTVLGAHREDVARQVEKLRVRTGAAAFAERHHAGTLDDQRRRRDRLVGRGVGTIFLALPQVRRPEDPAPWSPLATGT